jgi:uncharacterized protein YbaA (DUF1428 family)
VTLVLVPVDAGGRVLHYDNVRLQDLALHSCLPACDVKRMLYGGFKVLVDA